MKNNNNVIPIFFATDQKYVPLLSVALTSLTMNASKNYKYNIHILHSGLSKRTIEELNAFNSDVFSIIYSNVSEKLEKVSSTLQTRDYYSKTTYYRFFIRSLFPEYDKALYLDCDIVVLGDISKFYNIDLKDNYLGAVREQVVNSVEAFREYSRKVLHLEPKKYFNAGILLLNLDKMRNDKIDDVIFSMLAQYGFDTIAQDQDYLNYVAKGKVKEVDLSWNKEPIKDGYKKVPNLIHYAYFRKPWQNPVLKYGKYFWEYAKLTKYYDYFDNLRKEYTEQNKISDILAHQSLVKRAKKIIAEANTFAFVL